MLFWYYPLITGLIPKGSKDAAVEKKKKKKKGGPSAHSAMSYLRSLIVFYSYRTPSIMEIYGLKFLQSFHFLFLYFIVLKVRDFNFQAIKL